MRRALIAGSTGLIGRQLLQILLESDRYDKVIAVTRTDLPPHPKLEILKIRFDELTQWGNKLSADDVYCCLGTTMAKAGSRENFYQVDFFYPLLIAKTSQARGAKQYLLVSALGADPNSGIYYNRVKGEIEEAIRQVPFATIHIFRPSLLLGPREEKRSAETSARIFYRIFDFLIPRKYKAIQSAKVARAMFEMAGRQQPGQFVHESAQLQDY
jgi:uncharacterized protein YbjT (DUF2867 family)